MRMPTTMRISGIRRSIWPAPAITPATTRIPGITVPGVAMPGAGVGGWGPGSVTDWEGSAGEAESAAAGATADSDMADSAVMAPMVRTAIGDAPWVGDSGAGGWV